MSRIHIRCPHCDSNASVRSSREMSRTVRDIYLQCNDVECGHTYVAQLSIVRTLSPSSRPRPDVRLPLTPNRNPAPANDDAPPLRSAGA